MLEIINRCRCCESDALVLVHEFGKVPIADALTDTNIELEVYPLSTVFCKSCYHFQIRENISPKILFQNNYPYYSSKIPEVVQHFKKTYQAISQYLTIDNQDVIIEIAANDGVLISQFKTQTKHLISIEPSTPHAKLTERLDITTYNQFFNKEAAYIIRKNISYAPKLIIACNVFAHVPNPKDFVEGLSILSDDETQIVVEVPHSLPMFQNGLFDVIFHQHFSYFNLYAIKKLFQQYRLFINHVEKIPTQGGSLRIYISRDKREDNTVNQILNEELEFKLYELKTYQQFSKNILQLKSKTIELLEELKQQKKRIVGYGAPGKAANYLNYFGIGTNYLDALIDISDSKQGKYFPNTGLKIYSLEYFESHPVDYVFILVWNYADSIMNSFAYLKERDVRFIIGLPDLQVRKL